MKKIVSLLLILCFVLSLGGCAVEPDDPLQHDPLQDGSDTTDSVDLPLADGLQVRQIKDVLVAMGLRSNNEYPAVLSANETHIVYRYDTEDTIEIRMIDIQTLDYETIWQTPIPSEGTIIMDAACLPDRVLLTEAFHPGQRFETRYDIRIISCADNTATTLYDSRQHENADGGGIVQVDYENDSVIFVVGETVKDSSYFLYEQYRYYSIDAAGNVTDLNAFDIPRSFNNDYSKNAYLGSNKGDYSVKYCQGDTLIKEIPMDLSDGFNQYLFFIGDDILVLTDGPNDGSAVSFSVFYPDTDQVANSSSFAKNICYFSSFCQDTVLAIPIVNEEQSPGFVISAKNGYEPVAVDIYQYFSSAAAYADLEIIPLYPNSFLITNLKTREGIILNFENLS